MRWSLRGQRVEVIDHGQDSRAKRDLVALEPGRISLAVPALVVAVDDRRDRIGKRHGRDDLGAYLRMHLHPLEFLVGQRSGLRQDVLGHRELADVVQEGRGPDALHVGWRHAHHAAPGRRRAPGPDGSARSPSGPWRRWRAPALRWSPGARPTTHRRDAARLPPCRSRRDRCGASGTTDLPAAE